MYVAVLLAAFAAVLVAAVLLWRFKRPASPRRAYACITALTAWKHDSDVGDGSEGGTVGKHDASPTTDRGGLNMRWRDAVRLHTEPIPSSGNLYTGMPVEDRENFQFLLAQHNVRVERIVSTGQASPPGFWFNQDYGEWVVLLTGEAGLLIEGEAGPRTLKPGDWVHLPPACRHRVEWTAATEPTVWLAVHYQDPPEGV